MFEDKNPFLKLQKLYERVSQIDTLEEILELKSSRSFREKEDVNNRLDFIVQKLKQDIIYNNSVPESELINLISYLSIEIEQDIKFGNAISNYPYLTDKSVLNLIPIIRYNENMLGLLQNHFNKDKIKEIIETNITDNSVNYMIPEVLSIIKIEDITEVKGIYKLLLEQNISILNSRIFHETVFDDNYNKWIILEMIKQSPLREDTKNDIYNIFINKKILEYSVSEIKGILQSLLKDESNLERKENEDCVPLCHNTYMKIDRQKINDNKILSRLQTNMNYKICQWLSGDGQEILSVEEISSIYIQVLDYTSTKPFAYKDMEGHEPFKTACDCLMYMRYSLEIIEQSLYKSTELQKKLESLNKNYIFHSSDSEILEREGLSDLDPYKNNVFDSIGE